MCLRRTCASQNLAVVEREYLVPERRLVEPVAPVRPEVLVEQRHERSRHPGGEVDAVGHVPDGHRLRGPRRPELVPEIAGDLSMAVRDAVDLSGEPHGRDSHVKLAGKSGMGAQFEERLPVDADLLPHRAAHALELVDREGIVTGRHRRVGGEDATSAHLTARVGVAHALRHVLAQPLDEHEGGVSLIGVPDAGIDADRAEDTHATDTENPLLSEPQIGATGVQLVHQSPIVGVVDLEVGVEQKDGHPPDHHLPRPDMHGAARSLHCGKVPVVVAGHRHETP